MLEKELFLGVCFTILAGYFHSQLFLDMHTVDLYLNFGAVEILLVLQESCSDLEFGIFMSLCEIQLKLS